MILTRFRTPAVICAAGAATVVALAVAAAPTAHADDKWGAIAVSRHDGEYFVQLRSNDEADAASAARARCAELPI